MSRFDDLLRVVLAKRFQNGLMLSQCHRSVTHAPLIVCLIRWAWNWREFAALSM